MFLAKMNFIYRKADGWPTKLIMQLMPKQLIGNIGGAYLKNSKSVLFHPQQCEALDSLTKVMSSGFVSYILCYVRICLTKLINVLQLIAFQNV